MTQTIPEALDELVRFGLITVYTDDKTGQKMIMLNDKMVTELESFELEDIVSIES
jgi:hypothetical protein